MAASEREARVIALLEDCVRTELEVTNAGRGLGLSPEAIEDLMFGVTSGVLYGFAVDWDPDWVRDGTSTRGGSRTGGSPGAECAWSILRRQSAERWRLNGRWITRDRTHANAACGG